MTYLQFLGIFLFTPIAVLAFTVGTQKNGLDAISIWKWISILSAIAFAYTTLWDNYLVYRGVWFYGEDRVLGTIGYVPIEEYMFFILQPILTGLSLVHILSRSGPTRSYVPPLWKTGMTVTWLILSALGTVLLFASSDSPHVTYLGLILAWACPVLAGMAWLSADTFWRFKKAWALGILAPTLYLWFADRIAIGLGIWDISDTYSLDVDPFGLPVEEALFFMLTNILVVQGLLMFLPLKEH